MYARWEPLASCSPPELGGHAEWSLHGVRRCAAYALKARTRRPASGSRKGACRATPPGCSIGSSPLKSARRGRVALVSPDPTAKPLIVDNPRGDTATSHERLLGAVVLRGQRVPSQSQAREGVGHETGRIFPKCAQPPTCGQHAWARCRRAVLGACGRSIYDGRSAPTVRSDATRSNWLSKLHERKEKPIERTSGARSGAGRWIAAVLP